jgi:hypothetical protein
MPEPIPPAPNPNPLPGPVPPPSPLPSIQGYIRPWELAKIVLGTFIGGTIGFETIVPLLQQLAVNVDLWVISPQHQETAKLILGALIAVLSGVFMVKKYFDHGDPLPEVAKLHAAEEQKE